MKVTELRVGNSIFNSRENKVQIVNLFILDSVIKGNNDYLSIPLTEEWLLKFGFIRQPWGLCVGNLLFRDQNHECKELTLEIGNGFRTTVIYVHQLQNLYFALTADELIKK